MIDLVDGVVVLMALRPHCCALIFPGILHSGATPLYARVCCAFYSPEVVMAGSRPRTWSEAEDARLLELHSLGRTSSAVADAMGKSPSAVRRRAKALGLEWTKSAQIAAAVEANRERAAERQAVAELKLAAGLQVASDYLVKLAVDLQNDEEGFFYVKGRGGEMVKRARSADDPLPLEHVESVVRLLNDTLMTRAKVESMRKENSLVEKAVGGLLENIFSVSQSFEVDPGVWEENREARPSE